VTAAWSPVPAVDRDSNEWWDALARHELMLQRCDDCAAWRWPARALCNRCGATAWHWEAASGSGTVASWIVNHHAFDAGRPSPYVVVLVRLAEQDDILVPGSFAGSHDGRELTVGMPVTVGFDDVATPGGKRATLLRWQPSS